jgi:protein involved in polysaccharide export with SLBB domain
MTCIRAAHVGRNVPRWAPFVCSLFALFLVAGIPASRSAAQTAEGGAKVEATTPRETSAREPGDDNIDPTQPIKSNFIISVSVVGEPEPSNNYVVDGAGNVGIRYAGVVSPVRVVGLTPAEAQQAIAEFLKTYVKNPQVTVSIVSIPHSVVFVGGAVRNNGYFTITNGMTLVDVLSRAQWTDNADLSAIRVIRTVKSGDHEQVVTEYYKFDRYIQVKEATLPDEAQNPVLHDKDKIFVPFKSLPGAGSVSIYGEVGKPQRDLQLPAGQVLTVREAINLAGGTTTGANRRAIAITRPSLDKPLIIDLDRAEQGDPIFNIALKADDSIYVEKLQDNAYINVNGGFVKPGKYVYDKRTTLTEAVMEAGGPAPFAKTRNCFIYRHPDNDPKHSRVIAFNWTEIEKGKAADIELEPGDSVWMQSGVPPRPGLDVFQVLGGLTSAAYLFNTASGRYGVP